MLSKADYIHSVQYEARDFPVRTCPKDRLSLKSARPVYILADILGPSLQQTPGDTRRQHTTGP
jgi:hypothetical protein